MKRLSVISNHISPPALDAQVCGSGAPSFTGQVAVITGSGQGIGKEAARLFAEAGAAVVVSDLDAAKSDQVAQELRAKGLRAISVPGDVTSVDYAENILGFLFLSFFPFRLGPL